LLQPGFVATLKLVIPHKPGHPADKDGVQAGIVSPNAMLQQDFGVI
jgi:hypothetical protein